MSPAARVLAAGAALALSGCYTIRWERRGAVPEAGAPRDTTSHGVLGGAFQASGPVDLARACPDGFASVESGITLGDWLGQAVSSLPLAAIPVLLQAPIWEPVTVRVVCAKPGAARAARRTKLVVLPLAALGGVPEERVRLFGDALAGELRRRPGVSVVTQADVSALLGVEKTRQMLGCAESGCMADIGGALGADRVVAGSVGRVGSSLVVNLSALDPRRGAAAASVSERLRGGDEEAFLDRLPAIADALLAEPPAR